MEKLQKCNMAGENHSQKEKKKNKRKWLAGIEGKAENWKEKETLSPWLYSHPVHSLVTQAHNPPPPSALLQFSQDGFQDFPGGPAVKTPRFHFRGRSFDPWSGN